MRPLRKYLRLYPSSSNPIRTENLWGVLFILVSALLILLLLLAALRTLQSRPESFDTPKVSTYRGAPNRGHVLAETNAAAHVRE